jgi:hypothetical protein
MAHTTNNVITIVRTTSPAIGTLCLYLDVYLQLRLLEALPFFVLASVWQGARADVFEYKRARAED